jgi:hypothetical protein
MLLKVKEFKKNKNFLKLLLTALSELMYTSSRKKVRPDVSTTFPGVFIFRPTAAGGQSPLSYGLAAAVAFRFRYLYRLPPFLVFSRRVR